MPVTDGIARPCIGAILAGGRASRFGGTPKGLESLGARRLVDHVAAALADAADSLLLVTNARDGHTWLPGVCTAGDVHANVGSLGGLHAALAHAALAHAAVAHVSVGHAPLGVLVVAWDMPFVSAPLLRALRARGDPSDADAVLPRSGARGGGEPLCAWYAASCGPVAERLIATGERRAGALAEAVRTVWLDATPFGEPARLFANVNTPDDLLRARGTLDATA